MPDTDETCILVTCRSCSGWTAMMVQDANTTDADRRDDAKIIAAGLRNNRAVNTVAMEAARATPVCKCPRPAAARKVR